MFDFLSTNDYLYMAMIVVIVLIVSRVVKVLVVQDFYRSWGHLIRPFMIVVALVGIYVVYGKTRRVWDNLAYINNYEPGDEMDSWGLADKFSNKAEESEQKYAELMAYRAAWPVALIQPFVDTTSFEVKIKGDSVKFLVERIVKTTYNDTAGWQEQVDYTSELDALLNIDSLYLEVSKLNRNVLLLDSVYSMKIQTWLVTDSLRVRFIQDNKVGAKPESVLN